MSPCRRAEQPDQRRELDNTTLVINQPDDVLGEEPVPFWLTFSPPFVLRVLDVSVGRQGLSESSLQLLRFLPASEGDNRTKTPDQ